MVHDSLTKVNGAVEDKEIDICSLDGNEERVKSISDSLQGIRDLLMIDDYESRAKRTASLEEA